MNPRPQIACKLCQKVFTPVRANQEFCHVRCRNLFYYRAKHDNEVRPYKTVRNTAMAVLLHAKQKATTDKRRFQLERTELINGYTIKPTIAPNAIGYELHPPPHANPLHHNPIWFLPTRDAAVASIPLHRAHYHRRAIPSLHELTL